MIHERKLRRGQWRCLVIVGLMRSSIVTGERVVNTEWELILQLQLQRRQGAAASFIYSLTGGPHLPDIRLCPCGELTNSPRSISNARSCSESLSFDFALRSAAEVAPGRYYSTAPSSSCTPPHCSTPTLSSTYSSRCSNSRRPPSRSQHLSFQ